MEERAQQIPCPKCNFPILTSFYFCPNCGKKLKEPPFSMSAAKMLGLFAVSFFIPPLGLWPGIKLLMKNERRAQAFGMIAIFLTAISIVISAILLSNFVNSQFNSVQGQLKMYQNMGL